MSRSLLMVMLASLALGGCFEGGTQGSVGGDIGDAPLQRGLGVLLGVVVDDAIRPLAGALVNVTGQGVALNATTDADGRFRFPNLDPGAYVVEVTKEFYSLHQQAVVVLADVPDPNIVRFELVLEPGSVPYATVYKHEGYHECGFNFIRVCSNINIATWIVVCGQSGGRVCIGNVTYDRSVFFQQIDGNPAFLQAEMVWDATLPVGEEMTLLLGGGTEDELKRGVAVPAYNLTSGLSPLMARVTNHEGPSAWCNRPSAAPPCGERALEGSDIGVTRALLGQVDAGPTAKHPACGTISPCGAGWSMQQAFTLYTTVFYGYEPPFDWRFTDASTTPSPP